MPDFGAAERRILSFFKAGTKIIFYDREYEVIEADKPTCLSGEPKTDIFVRVSDGQGYEDIKISYKKENADFLENKTNAERAEQLFGSDWRDIIIKSTSQIKDQFNKRLLIYKKTFGKTKKRFYNSGMEI